MSRRRYISTDISVDKKIRRLSDSAALLYTWMIPHAEEDATLTSDPDELAAMVVPNRKGWTPNRVATLLTEIEAAELLVTVNGSVYFPPEAFYRHQSHIHTDRRRKEQPNKKPLQMEGASNNEQQVAQNSASSSSSFSVSSSKTLVQADGSNVCKFSDFWTLYPRKQSKGHAEKAWVTATKSVDASLIVAGLERQLPTLKAEERRYIPLPATWLNGKRWEDEVEGTSAPARLFTPDEEKEIVTALELYRAGDFETAQFSVSDELWCECMRRGRG